MFLGVNMHNVQQYIVCIIVMVEVYVAHTVGVYHCNCGCHSVCPVTPCAHMNKCVSMIVPDYVTEGAQSMYTHVSVSALIFCDS